jgi:hypothetical protein
MIPKIPLLLKFHKSDPDSGTDPECFKRLVPDPQHWLFVLHLHTLFFSAKYNNPSPPLPPSEKKEGPFLKFFSADERPLIELRVILSI